MVDRFPSILFKNCYTVLVVLFYGYYLGKNYDYIMSLVKKYIWLLFGLWILSIVPILITYKFMDVTYAQSNRFDLILYTVFTFLMILYTMKVLGSIN